MPSSQEDKTTWEINPPSPRVPRPLKYYNLPVNDVHIPTMQFASALTTKDYHNLLVNDVHIPTMQFASALTTKDWLNAAIGNAYLSFINSQEHSDNGRPSSCDDMDESESDDDDNFFFDAAQNLEDLLWHA
jgi:hypothetical protein